MPVLAGAGYSAPLAIEFARAAEAAGADGVLVLPPYLVVPEQKGLYRHYRAIADAVGIGLILYHRDNAVFTPETVARLAELDLLPHVEVLSCVSGGSIIGAYYYLELRSRMLELTDLEMTPDEYIAIVQRVEKRFLEGVQTNLRSSIATDSMA